MMKLHFCHVMMITSVRNGHVKVKIAPLANGIISPENVSYGCTCKFCYVFFVVCSCFKMVVGQDWINLMLYLSKLGFFFCDSLPPQYHNVRCFMNISFFYKFSFVCFCDHMMYLD